MNKTLAMAGSISGTAGAVVCLVSGGSRIAGLHYLAGFQSTTLFMAGIALMVFACMIKLDQLPSGQ
ncbi:MAG: hypothetical protein ACI9JM_000052 [Halioglobus sp.]|jgi:hypothetical protein